MLKYTVGKSTKWDIMQPFKFCVWWLYNKKEKNLILSSKNRIANCMVVLEYRLKIDQNMQIYSDS